MKNFIFMFSITLGVMMNIAPVTGHQLKVESTEIVSTPHFFKQFKDVVVASINSNETLMREKDIDVEKVREFASTLCENGYAEMKGTDQACRSVCVTAQGAIEDGLTCMLNSGEVKSVVAFFLTPLPATPLRKKGTTENLSSETFDSGRQYTLDLRENTVRALREVGGVIIAAYSKESYETARAIEENAEQFKIWDVEKEHVRVTDWPLDSDIPKELVGALYLITDKDDHQFYLPTQGVQAKDAGGGEAVWKKWLSLSHLENEGVTRATEMTTFIGEHGGQKVSF